MHKLKKYLYLPALASLLFLISCSEDFSLDDYSKVVLGQKNTSSNDNMSFGLSFANSNAIVNGNLVLADGFRILIYDGIPNNMGAQPVTVLGQETFATAGNITDSPSSKTVYLPFISSDGTRLIASDSNNHRVLIWNTLPTINNAPADVVLGQADFNSTEINRGGSATANTLNIVYGATTDGTKLFVSDSGNNRILIWNTIPTANGTPADVVLGQSDFTSTGFGTTSSTLFFPAGLWTNGSKLAVADYLNHRVLIWNSIPTSNGVAADIVLGQPNFTSNTANNGGISATTLSSPFGVTSDGTRFSVNEFSNHRVLLWNTFPSSNQEAASVVLGQPDFTSNTANNGGVSASGLSLPYSVTLHNSQLFVSDLQNFRVLKWNTIPSSNGVDADIVIGQTSFKSNGIAAPAGGPTSQTLSAPSDISTDSIRLAVADSGSNRILLWNSLPSSTQQPADVVLGQPDFTSSTPNNGGLSAASLNGPFRVQWDGAHLIVSDNINNRILIWNGFPSTNHQPADIVLGQPNFTSDTANNGGRSGQTLNSPSGIYSDGNRLIVTDWGNNRVLIWSTFPTVNQQAADLVLGQPNMTSGIANNGGRNAQSLRGPTNAFTSGEKLFVADGTNHRVLTWNTFPTVNQQSANIVIGQPDFTSGTPNNGGVSASTLSTPRTVFVKDNQLWIVDQSNNRILKWNNIPTANNTAADEVIGQDSFTSTPPNNGQGLHFNGFTSPYCFEYFNDVNYICDRGNNRILINLNAGREDTLKKNTP